MDSKLRGKTIGIVIAFISLVIFIVMFINYDKIAANTHKQPGLSMENPDSSDAGFRVGENLSNEELRAFVHDETFFDPDASLLESLDIGRQVSILVLSIQKDLRISILDVAGNLVTGQDFSISIEGLGSFTDDNEDGIIYIPSLSAGEYYVSLDAMEGFKVPKSTVNVSVKNEVDYVEIADITNFIKTEDEIDAAVEDTGVKDARSEAAGSENTLPVLSDGSYYFGIDVSKWNREINWKKVAAEGVTYAIIRCGYRGSQTGALVEDPYFKKNIEGALSEGIKVGLYFFTQATSKVEAVEEASMVLALCRGYELQYPIFIDTESAGGDGRADGLNRVNRTEVVTAFCQTIANSGYTAGVYASKNWYNTKLSSNELNGYAIWLAQYIDTPSYLGTYHMWQYTSKGTIDGISGKVDLNLSYLEK